MKAIKNFFFITADMEAGAGTGIKGHNGEEIILDKTMGSAGYKYATSHGVIDSVPGRVDKCWEYDVDLNPGEQVYFRHLVVDKRNKYEIEGKTVFAANYLHLCCVIRNGSPVMLEDNLLFEKILEPESALYLGPLQTKPVRGFIKNMGKVAYVSKSVSESGIYPRDYIMHSKDADYDLTIDGKQYFWTSTRSIIAKQKNGELHPQSDQMLVAPIEDTEIRGDLLLVKTQKKSQLKGVVMKIGSKVKSVKVGDEIAYFNGLNSEVAFDGQDYSVIREELVLGILQDHQQSE